MTDVRRDSEWARGWPLVVVGAIGMALTNLHIGSVGAVMQPLQAAFGWSRAQISASIFIVCACVFVLSPAVGWLIDRLGARRVALSGSVLFSLAFAAIGFAGPSIWSWYLVWALAGLFYPMVSTVAWTLGVGRVFDKQRGMAFALTLGGVGVGMFLAPLLSVALLPIVGWRGVFFALGLGALVIVFPLVWWLFNPDRAAPEPDAAEPAAAPVLTGLPLGVILKSARYWSLNLIAVLIASSVGGLILHFQPIMRDAGVSAGQAAGYAALCGPFSIAGHLAVGYLLDRFPARYVAAAFFGAPIIVCLLLLQYDGSGWMSLTAALILGVALGIEGDVMAYLTSRYFGLKHYGVAFGILIGVFSLAFGLSPVIAGAVFDAFGSYASVLWIFLAGGLVSVVLALLLGRPPSFEEEVPKGA